MQPLTHARDLRLLAASFGLGWVSIAMLAAPGPAAWVALSGRTDQAGAYFALSALAGAIGAAAGGRAMDRWGRRAVLAAAYATAAAGFVVAGAAFAAGSLGVFAAGIALASAATGVVYLTRLAAAEIFAPHERARAVARVQMSATFGAVVGPLALLLTGPLGAATGRSPDVLVWFVAPPLLATSALLVARARGLRGPAPRATEAAQRGARVAPRPFLVGVLALVCAQAAMVTVMGVTGVELKRAQGATATSLVMALHFLGMFALSLVVGRFADRAGRTRAILLGLALLSAGGLTVGLVGGVAGMALGLLVVGLGWSLAYIGGSVLLTDVVPAPRRARTMGGVDFLTALLAAVASYSGGVWYAGHGISGLGLAAAAFAALPIVAALSLRERAPGRYGADGAPDASPP